jgi:methionyl-tRNA synthetase
MGETRKILVTSALPYANGSIHIGHLVEYIQTDIWVRFQKMMKADCHYMCADDTHGTPIMLSARAKGITPEEVIGEMHHQHLQDFTDFHIEFDNYYTTHSPENQELAEFIYGQLKEGGHIVEKEIEQAWCPHDLLFLPDRLIRGTCPRCGAQDQYGDSCEACSATYSPTELVDARCSLCGTAPVRKSSQHYFFQLSNFQDRLGAWLDAGHVQEDMVAKIREWFDEGLRDWDISRDAPYFGFKIPGTEDKYFYVWLDAPIGYMASTMNWCKTSGRTFDEFWRSDDAEIVHFIGKDIVYFHTLFWPAMLMGAGFKPPHRVCIHGFLTVNGEKMSKSRGTFVSARTYLDHLDPEALRYYYAAKLGARMEDLNLSLDDFVARVNADVGNQFINLGSRVMSFLGKKLDGHLGTIDADGDALLKEIEQSRQEVLDLYEAREFNKVVRKVMALAHTANQYVANQAPWSAIKEDPEKARSICTAGVNAFAKLSVMLKPILPVLTGKIDKLLRRTEVTFDDIQNRLENRDVEAFEPIFTKLEMEQVDKMIEASKPVLVEAPPEYQVDPLADTVDFEGFAKVDLRVARVLKAEEIPDAAKLLRLTLDLGPLGKRIIFAGIKQSHKPEALVGRSIIVVANLAPRKMKFGVSEGMLLAAGPGGSDVFLLGVEEGVKPGMKVG